MALRTLVNDTFAAYANGDLPTVSGGVYTKPSAWGGSVTVVGHEVTCPDTGDHAAYLTAYTGTVPQWAALTNSTPFDGFGPSVFNDGVNSFYYMQMRMLGPWVLFRVKAGAFQGIASFPGTTTIAAGDVGRLEVTLVGGDPQLTAYKNNSLVGTYTDTDATHLLSGVPGFRLYDQTVRVSRFEAGDFGPVGGGGGFGTDGGAIAISARRWVAITPSDTLDLSAVPDAIWVGGAGDLALVGIDGSQVVLKGVRSGDVLSVRVRRISATGTTATNLVGLWE